MSQKPDVLDVLDDFIDAELYQPVMAEAQALVRQIVEETQGQALGVLFYGSCLRTNDGAGLMDFYVLTQSRTGYGKGVLAQFFHQLVPPFVRYIKGEYEGKMIHAKVAIMTLSRFEALARHKAFDVSIWARFAQPSALVYAKNESVKGRVHSAIRNAVITATNWAVYFGPTRGQSDTFWSALFRATYGAELRIEDKGRADQIVALFPQRYDIMFLPALSAAGYTPVTDKENMFCVSIPGRRRRVLKVKWLACQIASKAINMARIIKGAVTFDGRADYVAWKLERRTGITLHLTPWQRSHPLLSVPKILLQMRRKGAFRKRH